MPAGVKPFGSYEVWSSRIRNALVNLEIADPQNTMDSIESDEPEAVRLKTILSCWAEAFVQGEKTAAQVIAFVNDHDAFPGLEHLQDDFRDALVEVAGAGGRPDAHKLGHWLRRVSGRFLGGMSIKRVDGKKTRWKLHMVKT